MKEESEFEKEMKAARAAEYGEYNRFMVRYLPCIVAATICYMTYEGAEIYKNGAIIIAFFFCIEAMYDLLAKDSWLLSLLTWSVWGWFYYSWFLGGNESVWLSIASPLAFLLISGRVLWYSQVYQQKKFRSD